MTSIPSLKEIYEALGKPLKSPESIIFLQKVAIWMECQSDTLILHFEETLKQSLKNENVFEHSVGDEADGIVLTYTLPSGLPPIQENQSLICLENVQFFPAWVGILPHEIQFCDVRSAIYKKIGAPRRVFNQDVNHLDHLMECWNLDGFSFSINFSKGSGEITLIQIAINP